jgi:hypothetical protein
VIGLGLTDPVPQCFGVDVQLLGQPAEHRLRIRLSVQPHRPRPRSRSSGGYFLVPTMMSSLGLHDQTWFGILRGSGEAHYAERSSTFLPGWNARNASRHCGYRHTGHGRVRSFDCGTTSSGPAHPPRSDTRPPCHSRPNRIRSWRCWTDHRLPPARKHLACIPPNSNLARGQRHASRWIEANRRDYGSDAALDHDLRRQPVSVIIRI